MNYFKSNLKYLRKLKGLTQDELAQKINVSRPKIGSYEEGRAEPKFETLQNISHFFQVTLDILLQKNLAKSSELLISKSEGKDLRVLPILVNSSNEELIPIVPVKAAAGYMNSYDDIEFIEKLPHFSLPLQEFSQGTYRAFQIKGDSMLPVQPGSYILAEHVENWNWIKDGECCVIISQNEGVVYKRLYHKSEDEHSFELRSDNKTYEPYSIHLSEVAEIWKAKGFLTFELPKPKEELSVNELSSMLLDLKNKVDNLK